MSDKFQRPDAGCDPVCNFTGRSRLARLADFLYEVGMLRKTPRTGYQFLGTGSENVAEHTLRTVYIGIVLAHMAGAHVERTAMLCLVHDFHEARVGDLNYVSRIYSTVDSRRAMEHATSGTGLEPLLLPLWDEQEKGLTREALLARDADQLDLIMNLHEERAKGNTHAGDWLEAAEKRLRTEEGRTLAQSVAQVGHTDWWFKGPDPEWWTRKK